MKNILVPVDFSSAALNAARYSIELAKKTKAKVIFFHAYLVPGKIRGYQLVTEREILDDCCQKMLAFIKNLNQRYDNIHYRLRRGSPVNAIRKAARETKAELIILGITGGGPVKEKLIGSTAIDLARASEFPLIIVPAGASFSDMHKVAIAVDPYTGLSASSLGILYALKENFGSEMSVVNVVTDEKAGPHILKMESDLDIMNIPYTVHHPAATNVGIGLDSFLRQSGSQLLAIIPRKHGFFEDLFDSGNTKRLAFHTTIPLLTLPGDGAELSVSEQDSSSLSSLELSDFLDEDEKKSG
jgi:nucleotide-binding universal stress UspA family protein